MIRACQDSDFGAIYAVINDAARAYKTVIPADRWHEPYMSEAALSREIGAGVRFFGFEEDGELVGVMGIQNVADVTLIRHAYVRTDRGGRGIGSKLLAHLRATADRPILIGTWAAADWAIRFYENRGFRVLPRDEGRRLLEVYWSIPQRQIATSVVIADETWIAGRKGSRD